MDPESIESIRADLAHLCKLLQADLSDDEPEVEITVATDGAAWNYQTGDNSFTGGAYGLPHWHVTTIDRDTDPAAFAEDAIDDWSEQLAMDA